MPVFGGGPYGGAPWSGAAGSYLYSQVIQDDNFQKNVVIQIDAKDDTYYFAQYKPDLGLSLPEDRIGVISDPVVNAAEIDVRGTNSSIGTFSWRMSDPDGDFTALAGPRGLFYGRRVTVWYGRILLTPETRGALSFGRYKKVTTGIIGPSNWVDGVWHFNATESIDLLQTNAFATTSNLMAPFAMTDTRVFIQDISGFPNTGMVLFGKSTYTYTGKTEFSLTNQGLVGWLENLVLVAPGGPAEDHSIGDSISFLYKLGPDRPFKLLLQFIISPGGGGDYDVLPEGCGVPQELVDIEAFEALDDDLVTPNFTWWLHDLGGGLDFIQKQVLLPTGTRIFMKDGKISIIPLARTTAPTLLPEFNEDIWKGRPQIDVDNSYLANSIRFMWNKDFSSGNYLTTQNFKDQASIDDFKETPVVEYKFDLQVDDDTFMERIGNQLLYWLSTPKCIISGTTNWKVSESAPGDLVHVTHSQVPQQGSGIGIADFLKVLSRKLDIAKSQVAWKLIYPAFAGIRYALIAPTGPVLRQLTASKLQLDPLKGTKFLAGYALRLFDLQTDSYTADPTNVVTSVVGDVLTFQNSWSTVMTDPDRYVLRFCRYDDPLISPVQKGFAFIAPNPDEVFPDGSAAYKIGKNF